MKMQVRTMIRFWLRVLAASVTGGVVDSVTGGVVSSVTGGVVGSVTGGLVPDVEDIVDVVTFSLYQFNIASLCFSVHAISAFADSTAFWPASAADPNCSALFVMNSSSCKI